MTLAQRWRRFWSRSSYVPRNEYYATTLKAYAPVVTRDEVATLERKWRKPVNWNELGVLE